MRERGVPDGQLLASQGGERHALAPGVTVRVFPSVHTCTWILNDVPADCVETGHTGLTQVERAQQPGLGQRIWAMGGTAEGKVILDHIRGCAGSLSDGGPLVFLIETPQGSIFFQDTSGCWTGVLEEISADAAILAAAGRANVDGEPIQGSVASSSPWRRSCWARAPSSSATTTTGCRRSPALRDGADPGGTGARGAGGEAAGAGLPGPGGAVLAMCRKTS